MVSSGLPFWVLMVELRGSDAVVHGPCGEDANSTESGTAAAASFRLKVKTSEFPETDATGSDKTELDPGVEGLGSEPRTNSMPFGKPSLSGSAVNSAAGPLSPLAEAHDTKGLATAV